RKSRNRRTDGFNRTTSTGRLATACPLYFIPDPARGCWQRVGIKTLLEPTSCLLDGLGDTPPSPIRWERAEVRWSVLKSPSTLNRRNLKLSHQTWVTSWTN